MESHTQWIQYQILDRINLSTSQRVLILDTYIMNAQICRSRKQIIYIKIKYKQIKCFFIILIPNARYFLCILYIIEIVPCVRNVATFTFVIVKVSKLDAMSQDTCACVQCRITNNRYFRLGDFRRLLVREHLLFTLSPASSSSTKSQYLEFFFCICRQIFLNKNPTAKTIRILHN